VGIATSGTMSPTFRKGIGLGYVKTEEAWEGNEISIMIRQKKFPARIVKIPFYKRPLIHHFKIGKGEYNYGIAG
jgi:aminomethyltransferase